MNPNFWEILAAGIFIGFIACVWIIGILWIKREGYLKADLEAMRRLLGP